MKDEKGNAFVAAIISVLLALLLASAFLAVHFSFPTKAGADEATKSYQKEAIIFLCDDNAELSQTLDDLVGINVLSSKQKILILPTSHFFRLVKEMAMDGKQNHDYTEILDKLLEENDQLKSTLRQIIFRAERIK